MRRRLSDSTKLIAELENLARIGKLKIEPGAASEIAGLIASGTARLIDAKNPQLSYESRFDLAHNAAHALALAAMRHHGYRSDNRYIVFQALPHTIGLAAAQWRILAKAHEKRNLAEYEGHFETDEQLLKDMLAAAESVRQAVTKLKLP
jgi:hypothetical protein